MSIAQIEWPAGEPWVVIPILMVGMILALAVWALSGRLDAWLSASERPLRCPKCGQRILNPPSPGHCPRCGFCYHRWEDGPENPPLTFDPSRLDLRRFGKEGRVGDEERFRTGADNLREN